MFASGNRHACTSLILQVDPRFIYRKVQKQNPRKLALALLLRASVASQRTRSKFEQFR